MTSPLTGIPEICSIGPSDAPRTSVGSARQSRLWLQTARMLDFVLGAAPVSVEFWDDVPNIPWRGRPSMIRFAGLARRCWRPRRRAASATERSVRRWIAGEGAVNSFMGC
jgi:hypothetical protein